MKHRVCEDCHGLKERSHCCHAPFSVINGEEMVGQCDACGGPCDIMPCGECYDYIKKESTGMYDVPSAWEDYKSGKIVA